MDNYNEEQDGNPQVELRLRQIIPETIGSAFFRTDHYFGGVSQSISVAYRRITVLSQ